MGRQRPWRFPLPPGIADPYFACELALEMNKSLRELGESMDNHELCVVWPAFFAERQRVQEIEEAQQEKHETMQRRRL
jgi:hypothetical protein